MKNLINLFVLAGITGVMVSCGSMNRVTSNDNDDLYSVRPTSIPVDGGINDDLSYSAYKYQKDEEQYNSYQGSSLNQTTIYANNYTNFYSPYNSYYNYGMGRRHPMYSFGFSSYNYGYNPYYGYPSYMSYGYNPYYGYGNYPSYMFGYGYPSAFGNPYGYNPYYYYGMGYGYSSFYGNGGYPYYGYNPYGYGYNDPYYHGNYGYGNNGGIVSNNTNGSSISTGIHYSGPRQNNSGGGIVTRPTPGTVGMQPIQTTTLDKKIVQPTVTSIKANDKIINRPEVVKPINKEIKEEFDRKPSTIINNQRPIQTGVDKNINVNNGRVINSNNSMNREINRTVQPIQRPNSTIQNQKGDINRNATPTRVQPIYNNQPSRNQTPQNNYRSTPIQNNNYNSTPNRSSGNYNSGNSGNSRGSNTSGNSRSSSGGNFRGGR